MSYDRFRGNSIPPEKDYHQLLEELGQKDEKSALTGLKNMERRIKNNR